MSTLKSNVIEPATGTNLTLGASGDLIDVTSDALQLNTWKDSGGNTLFVSDGSGNLSSVNSALDKGGGPNLILSQTASASSSISFTSDIDSTYDKYMFVCLNINPATNSSLLQFQVSTDGGTSYGMTITSTFFRAYHNENDGGSGLTYQTSYDLAQSTSYQWLTRDTGNLADETCAGILYLYAPASTTYVKHFYSNFVTNTSDDQCHNSYVAGYVNSTSAVDAINFKMDNSSNFDGKIKMYGCR